MDIVESINRYLVGTPVGKGERTRLTRARDEIVRLREFVNEDFGSMPEIQKQLIEVQIQRDALLQAIRDVCYNADSKMESLQKELWNNVNEVIAEVTGETND